MVGAGSTASGGATGTGGGTPIEDLVEIFSWWTSGDEAAALGALVDVFHADYPSTSVVNAAASSPTTARNTLKTRLALDEPPDTFQAVSGEDIGASINAGLLTPLDGQLGLSTAFPDEVIGTVSHLGKPYAVPLTVDRDNQLYYGTEVLVANGVTPPKSLADFYTACAKLHSNAVAPLSLSPAGWMMALTVFENLMPVVNGGAFYVKFFSGNADLTVGSEDRAQLVKLFEEFDKVLGCSNVATAASSSWVDAANALVSGSAAMAVAGPWVKGYLEQADWTAGTDFGVVPGLGSSGYYVFNSAVFPLPENAQHPDAAAAFLGAIASEAGQLAFNESLRSVPARLGVSLAGFDALTKASAGDYAAAASSSNTLLPGYPTMASLTFQAEVNRDLLVFALGGDKASIWDKTLTPQQKAGLQGDVDYIVARIAANYSSI